MALKIPLRYGLPLVFLGLSVALMTAAYVLRSIEIERRNEDLMVQRATGLAQFMAPDLGQRLAHGETTSVAEFFSRLSSVPHLNGAFLCDPAGRIIYSSRASQVQRSLAEVAPAFLPITERARSTRQITLEFSTRRDLLRLVSPLQGDANPGGAVWFCTESDVAGQTAPAHAIQRQITLLILGAIFFCVAILWWLLDRTITKPVGALTAATRALSAGKLETRSGLAGATVGEFSQLGLAFDRMAAEIQAREDLLRANEARLRAIITTEPECVKLVDAAGRLLEMNPAGLAMLEVGSLGEVQARPLAEWISPEHRAAFAAVHRGVFQGETRELAFEVIGARGTRRWLETHATPLRDGRGDVIALLGVTRDITARKRSEELVIAQRDLFEQLVREATLAQSLEAICRFAEARTSGWLCSILLLDAARGQLHHGAAPSLPPDYCKAIDGIAIGPSMGSCGTAAHRGEPVIVTDIQVDPLWANFRALAAAHDLRACWSTPIRGVDGVILGTFAMYDRRVRAPDFVSDEIIKVATHAASIAIQRARRAAEFQQSEERFAKAFRASPAALVISRLSDGRLLDVNNAFLRLFQITDRTTILGRSAVELGLWPDPTARTRLAAQIAATGSVPPLELPFRIGTGEIRDGLCSAERIEINGEPCVLSLLVDITERNATQADLVRAERERARQLAMLETSLDSLSEGVIICSPTGELYYWNRAALALHDYKSLDECRRKLPEFTATFELARADGSIVPFEEWPLVRTLRGESVRDWEVRLRHKQARWEKLMVYTCGLARDAVGQPLLAVVSMIDITARRHLEEQLRQSQKMDAIGQLAGGIAHDFNNMLTAIVGQAELARLDANLPPATIDALREIRRASDRASSLTNQLLAFSRRQVMQLRPLDLNGLVASDARMLQRIVGEDVRLHLHRDSGPLPILADEAMLGQVLLNLVVNARDAMPRGGEVHVRTSVREVDEAEVRLHPDTAAGPHACLSIQDSGTGIAPEHMEHIFEPFFTTKAPGKGTGLGLATVFGIVRQHRGWVTAESKPGEGATFFVFLPLATTPAAPATPAAATAATPGSGTILLVEDEPIVRGTTRLLLERHGYRVIEAEDGRSALARWQQHRAEIRLLLTDIVMPGGISGRELAERLAAESPTLRIVLMTGYSADIAGRDLSLRTHQEFLQKPFASDDLFAMVNRALAAK